MIRKLMLAFFALSLFAAPGHAGDLVRIVRYKLSAGDLASGVAAVEDYKLATGVDAEYLDAVGWLARGAEMQGRSEVAKAYVAELRREIRVETPELIVPLGAAIEVEGRLIAAQSGHRAAIRFLEGELAHASAPALRSRINKNINLLHINDAGAPRGRHRVSGAIAEGALTLQPAKAAGDQQQSESDDPRPHRDVAGHVDDAEMRKQRDDVENGADDPGDVIRCIAATCH